MINFEEEFIKSKGKPISYKDTQLFMADTWVVNKGDTFKMILESFNSEWKQAVKLSIKNGSIRMDGDVSDKGFRVWQNPLHKEVIFSIEKTKKNAVTQLFVSNVWDPGTGTVEGWHSGAAMIIEETGFGKRYLCNDGHLDDDFDDLIFTIEKI